jgi:hypothetical protein
MEKNIIALPEREGRKGGTYESVVVLFHWFSFILSCLI